MSSDDLRYILRKVFLPYCEIGLLHAEGRFSGAIGVDAGQCEVHAKVPFELEGFEGAAVAAAKSHRIATLCVDVQVGVFCRPQRLAKGSQFRIGAVLRGGEEGISVYNVVLDGLAVQRFFADQLAARHVTARQHGQQAGGLISSSAEVALSASGLTHTEKAVGNDVGALGHLVEVHLGRREETDQ